MRVAGVQARRAAGVRHRSSTDPQEEDRRRICRERKTLTAERVEHVNRIKGLLFAQGISDYEPLLRKRRSGLRNSGPVMVVRYLSI